MNGTNTVSNVTQFPKKNPKIEGEWVLMNPDLAFEWLEKDTVNRPTSQDRINRYAEDMRSGKWDEDNGETIKIAPDGGVLDGQHRLWAVNQANVKIRFFVFFNVDKESFKTIDAGMPRTKGQVVGMAGVKYSNTISAMAGVVMAIEENKYSLETSSPSKMFQRSDIVERAISQRADFEAAVRVGQGTGKLLSITVASTAVYLVCKTSKAGNPKLQIESFMKQLSTGVYDNRFVADKHPVYILREKLNDNRASLSKMTAPMLLALTIKAWNAYSSGRSVSASGLRMVQGERWPTVM